MRGRSFWGSKVRHWKGSTLERTAQLTRVRVRGNKRKRHVKRVCIGSNSGEGEECKHEFWFVVALIEGGRGG